MQYSTGILATATGREKQIKEIRIGKVNVSLFTDNPSNEKTAQHRYKNKQWNRRFKMEGHTIIVTVFLAHAKNIH